MERSISAISAFSDRQNPVFRMIRGGSAGFRTIMAFPLDAPPTRSIARAVVSVNSSMLARVPPHSHRDPIRPQRLRGHIVEFLSMATEDVIVMGLGLG